MGATVSALGRIARDVQEPVCLLCNAAQAVSLWCACRPETWREVLSTEDEGQRLARLEEYTGHLDTVESQLLREIAARSEHFFEASGVVQVRRPRRESPSSQRSVSQIKTTWSGVWTNAPGIEPGQQLGHCTVAIRALSLRKLPTAGDK